MNFYLVAAIAGAVIPYLFFINFFMNEGVDVLLFVEGIFANGAAGGFAADIFISSGVFWTYMMSKKEPKIWIFVVLNLTIGLSCALPAYLYVVAKRRVAAEAQI